MPPRTNAIGLTAARVRAHRKTLKNWMKLMDMIGAHGKTERRPPTANLLRLSIPSARCTFRRPDTRTFRPDRAGRGCVRGPAVVLRRGVGRVTRHPRPGMLNF